MITRFFGMILTLYILLAAVFAVPYFNWQYAKQHGVVSWVFFGEFISTGKAAAWPYYAVTAWNANDTDTTDIHFANSRRAADEALRRIDQFGGIAALPSTEVHTIVDLLRAAVSEAELVDDAYLQQAHSEFRRRFRNEYTVALRILAHGMETNDAKKQILAAELYNEFSTWVSEQADQIAFQ